MVNLEFEDKYVELGVYTTSMSKNTKIQLNVGQQTIFEQCVDLAPEKPFMKKIPRRRFNEEYEYKLCVFLPDNQKMICYQPEKTKVKPMPEPAKAIKPPRDIHTMDELYQSGLHLEQYRHATYEPDPYYLKGLKRHPEDARMNLAYGILLLRQGQFQASEQYLRQAIQILTAKNPNAYINRNQAVIKNLF
jgi:hypothetical protein